MRKSDEDLVVSEATKDESTLADSKGLLWMVLGIAALFLLIFGGLAIYNHFTNKVVSIDELHQQNLAGKLKPEQGYMYNGYSFVKADGLWWTELNKFGTTLKVPLHFGPKELESILVQGNLDSRFNEGDQLYITINPNITNKYYSLAVSELSFNVVKGLDRTPVGSCTQANWACENRTILSCEQNPAHQPIVELDFQGDPGIEIKGSCIKLTGDTEFEIVKSVERLLYQWYGVMT